MIDTDVLVVGLGSAGAAIARALADEGRRVLAIDKRTIGATGARWVNAVPRWCFEHAGVLVPSGDELFVSHDPHALEGREGAHAFHLVAPDGKSSLRMDAPPVLHVDMRKLVDRLVADAQRAGVETRHARVSSIELRGDRVIGVRIDQNGTEELVRTRLVIDASGIGGSVRTRVPQLATICPAPDPEHRCVAAQYQFEVKDRAALEEFLAQHGARLGHDVAFPGIAGGYSTLTLFTSPTADRVGVLTGSIPAIGVAEAQHVLDRFVARHPWIGARLFGGRGAIPVRRPYRVLARSGVALLGDAACQVHAAHGSGVGMGLVAARLLVEATRGADDPGSDAVLRAYERSFHRTLGGVLSVADAFRRHIQGATAEELSSLLSGGLLDASLAMDALVQRPTRADLSLAMRMAPRAARSPRVAMSFLPLAAKSAIVDRVGRFTGSARIGDLVDRSLDSLLGDAPRAPGRGAWREAPRVAVADREPTRRSSPPPPPTSSERPPPDDEGKST
ncbi:MAG: FAD-dependent monooxygenase [Deltaproteobacteria bacterium]|nr:FAD-dependent monooxygenase [Deltaproteobacteria bacterium]